MPTYKTQEKLTGDIFVEPFPLGYGLYVWVVLRDGVPYRVFSSEDGAEKEISYLESLDKLLLRPELEPENDDLGSRSKGPGLEKPK